MSMNDLDLETLRTEYEATLAELDQQHAVTQRAQHAATAAANALIDAITDAGLTQYGPITSRTEWHPPSQTWRRTWTTKEKHG